MEREKRELDDPVFEETTAAIERYWSTVGALDPNVLSFILPEFFSSAPPWPGLGQAYQIVRTDQTVVIASLGLGAPFIGDGPMDQNGFEMEIYVEAPADGLEDLERVKASWRFEFIRLLSVNVPKWTGLARGLREIGVVSTEIPAFETTPDAWRTEKGMLGVLLNVGATGRPTEVADAPLSPILMCSATVIRPEELRFLIDGGDAARGELADRIRASALGPVSDWERPSFV